METDTAKLEQTSGYSGEVDFLHRIGEHVAKGDTLDETLASTPQLWLSTGYPSPSLKGPADFPRSGISRSGQRTRGNIYIDSARGAIEAVRNDQSQTPTTASLQPPRIQTAIEYQPFVGRRHPHFSTGEREC